jgi:hypothetical protein
MHLRAALVRPLFALLLGVIASMVAPPGQAADPAATGQEVAGQELQIAEQLSKTLAAIEAKQDQVKALQQRLATTPEGERAEIEAEIAEVEESLSASRDHFESLAVGGVSLGTDDGETPVDWRTELQEIAKPVLSSLKSLTERPRTRDRLRTQIEIHEENLQLTDKALASLEQAAQSDLPPAVASRVDTFREEWQARRETTVQDLDMLRYQLAQLEGETSSMLGNLDDSVRKFLSGRGLTLLLALSAAVFAWWIMRLLTRLVFRTRDPDATRPRAPGYRIGLFAFRLATGFLVLSVVFLVLYVAGDWFLLGLGLLVLIGAAIGLRNTLPRYMNEARLFLNMGPVREGERVIYGGLPWRIRSLNIYSTLFNPELQGGVVRLPSSEMAKLISRPDHKGEPWFPTRAGDVLLLEGDVLAKVLLQTPEVVRLRYRGAVRDVPTASFLGLEKQNLSRDGFVVPVTFGVDYAHQAIAVDEIAPGLRAGVEARLGADYGDHLLSVDVSFKAAGTSSLDYLIIAEMKPGAAGDYFAIQRAIQQTCVTVCNTRGWRIPFPQLVVHHGD